MNPVLIKPEGEHLQARWWSSAGLDLALSGAPGVRPLAAPVAADRDGARGASLRARALVLIEGAGSPAEINLRSIGPGEHADS